MRKLGFVLCVAGVALCVNGKADLAREVLDASDVGGGIVVHLGCDDPEVTAGLRVSDHYIVHGLHTDEKTVAAARKHIKSTGAYGDVSVMRFDGRHLPYANELINLVVSEDLGDVPMDEVMRVLCPNGMAYIKANGQWNKTVKPWPEDVDEWTHFLYDASNNAFAQDERVAPPRQTQWVAKPLWLRSHETPSGISTVVSAAGRVFYILDEGVIGITDPRLPDTWSLIARDAFNGVQLWKKPLKGWGWTAWSYEKHTGKDWTEHAPKRTSAPPAVTRRLVTDGERIFVTLGYREPLSILDAATGEQIRAVKGTENTDEILYHDGTVLVAIRDLSSGEAERRGKVIPERLIAVDAETGKHLWETPVNGLVQLSPAIDNGRVFCQGRDGVIALDLKTGEHKWRMSDNNASALTLVAHDGVVLVSDRQKVRALNAENGELMWKHVEKPDKGAPAFDLIVAHGLVWRGIGGVGRDLRTGEVKKELSIENLRSKEHHHRCFRSKATPGYLISAMEGMEFLDFAGDGDQNRNSRNNWVRGACNYGVMPANGYLYVPPDQCFCEPGVKLLGFCALAGETEYPIGNEERFEKGSAYGTVVTGMESVLACCDWPTYRGGPARNGSTDAFVPSELKPGWRTKLGGRLSAPTTADGKLFVATVDAHTLHALDLNSGEPLWTYTTGGRIDSPPTICDDIVLMGSADGWVYCLRASDGELVWRFRAAPKERLVSAFGQVESAWPLHGSVLMQNGVAYVSAGRSSYLDDGVFLYGLDPMTGKVLHETVLEGPHGDVKNEAEHSFWLDGNRNDVLVGDGTHIYQGQSQFDNNLAGVESPFISEMGDREMGLHLFSTAGLLDDSWYNRAYWMYSARWPGFYIANQAPKTGQLLVFDNENTYGVKVFTRRNNHSPMFFPATDGYLLFADANDNEPQLVDEHGQPEPVEWLPQSDYSRGKGRGIKKLTDTAVNMDKYIGFTRSEPPLWQEWYPIRIQAMVKAKDTLFVAGPPDVLDPKDPLAAFEGRRGALLCAVSAKDGKKIAELELDAAPVLDGLIATDDHLFLTLKDGSVMSFGGS